MSQTATTFDLKSFLVDQIRGTTSFYLNDLKHLPDDKLSASPMGSARSPLAFTAECAGFNLLLAGVISGQPLSASPEERKAYAAQFSDYESADKLLRESAEVLVRAVEGRTEAELVADSQAPWGQPMKVYELALLASNHMNYHDGQINYIQTLYGDVENHWG